MEASPKAVIRKSKRRNYEEHEQQASITRPDGNVDKTLLIGKENQALSQQRSGYLDIKLGVFIVAMIHLVFVAIFLSVYYYYAQFSFYYGYQALFSAMPPPGDCCDCDFPAWKPLLFGTFYAFTILEIFLVIWMLGETPRQYIRYQLYHSVFQWVFSLVYFVYAIFMVLSIFWCNGPGFNLNVCNDRNWECHYNNITSPPTCFECPSFVMPMNDLVYNPAYLVTMIYSIVNLVIFIVTIILVENYGAQKFKYSTYGLVDPSRIRLLMYRQMGTLAIFIIVIAMFIMAAIIGSISYLLATSPASEIPLARHYEFPLVNPPGALIDESFNTKWILYFIWSVTGLILPIVALWSVYPTSNGAGKVTAAAFSGFWVAKDLIILIIMLILYFTCNLFSQNPCTYPPDTTIVSPIFRVIAITTIVQLVLEVLLFIGFLILYRLLGKLVRMEGDIQQFDALSGQSSDVDEVQLLDED